MSIDLSTKEKFRKLKKYRRLDFTSRRDSGVRKCVEYLKRQLELMALSNQTLSKKVANLEYEMHMRKNSVVDSVPNCSVFSRRKANPSQGMYAHVRYR